jgi:hypothetical protein
MKVTKTTKEYIGNKVYEKAMNSDYMLELKRKAEEAQNQFDADMKAIQEKCEPFIKELADKYPSCTFESRKPYVSIRGIDTYTLPENVAYREARSEMSKKVHDAVQEIIVEMELGGTKAELMEKLNALEF